MRKKSCLVSGFLMLNCFGVGSASAVTYFYDDFETQPVTSPGQKMQLPPVGLPYFYNPDTQVEAANVVTSPLPVIGTKSLEEVRTSSLGPDVAGISNQGVIQDGKKVEVDWSHELSGGTGTTANAPMQISIEYVNGGVGQLAFITINDDFQQHNGYYFYSDAFGQYQTPTELKPTLNGWDKLRMVMTFQSYDATYMTGSYDLFISLNGAPEVQVASNVSLLYAQKATVDDAHAGDPTSLMFRTQMGPMTSNNYYDNIWVHDYGADVPAPSNWNIDANGNGSTASNWSSGVPNGVNATAIFGAIVQQSRTVTINSPQTLGTLAFSSPFSYNLIGSAAITMDDSSGQAAIDVFAGDHTIAAPVVLNKDTTITARALTSLSLTGNLTATGKTITKVGAGTVQFENVRAAGLVVNEGTAKISTKAGANSAPGTSVLSSLTIASGAQLDLANNSLVIDYSSVGTLMTDLRQNLSSHRLATSAAATGQALGYADNAILAKGTFGGQTPDLTSALVMFTWQGDTNLDGKVNALDFNALASSFGSSNAVWTQGDFNYDGVIDTNDFTALALNFNAAPISTVPGLASLVPEPTAIGMLGLAIATMYPRRKQGTTSSQQAQ